MGNPFLNKNNAGGKRPSPADEVQITNSRDSIKDDDNWSELLTEGVATGLSADKLGDSDKSKKYRTIITIIAAVVIIVCSVAGFLVLRSAVDTRMAQLNQNKTAVQQKPEISEVKPETKEKTSGMTNPSMDSNEVGDPATGDVNLTVVDGKSISIKTSKGESRVQLSSLTDQIKTASVGCDLKEVASNCYLGEAKQGDKTVRIWGFRDAKSSALLQSTTDAKNVPANGSAVSFVRPVDANGKQVVNMYVVMGDQTGVIISADDQSVITEIASGSSHMEVTSAI